MNLLSKACIPEKKTYVPDPYDWLERHEQIIAANTARNPELILIGDSMFHYWGGIPEHEIKRGADSWDATFEPYHAVNMGFGLDQTQHILWRLQNGELNGISPKVVILEGGNNNYRTCENGEIVDGMHCLLDEVGKRLPSAKIILFSMTPNAIVGERYKELNEEYRKFDGYLDGRVRYLDVSSALLGTDGKVDLSLFTDGKHPNNEGNRRLAAIIKPVLDELMA